MCKLAVTFLTSTLPYSLHAGPSGMGVRVLRYSEFGRLVAAEPDPNRSAERPDDRLGVWAITAEAESAMARVEVWNSDAREVSKSVCRGVRGEMSVALLWEHDS